MAHNPSSDRVHGSSGGHLPKACDLREDSVPWWSVKDLLPPRDRPSSIGVVGLGGRFSTDEESWLVAWSAGRVRVERGLYRVDNVYWACATPIGQRTARWLKLGAVGIQEARRLRDEFAYKLRSGQLARSSRRVSVCEAAATWFNHLDELVAAGELRSRTVASYKDGVRLHFLPKFGSRQVGSIAPDDLVSWHEAQRRTGAAAWSIRARWMGVRGLLGHAARTGLIVANPCRRPRPT